MENDYRITIRTDLETANAFRELAHEENLQLGEMLAQLICAWPRRVVQRELHAKLLAMKYGN